MDGERNPVRLAYSIQTCFGCPSQWDAWTVDGRKLYLRYRHGNGRVDLIEGDDASVETYWEDGSDDGIIGLEEFCAKANLVPPKPAMIFERVYRHGL